MVLPNFVPELLEYGDYVNRLFKEDYLDVEGSLAFDLTFQITDDCCLNCSYCYQGFKGKHKMSLETAKTAIDQILEGDPKIKGYIDSWSIPAVVINFIGGEPFLEIDLINEITEYFINRMIELRHPWATKFQIGITTNGVLYFDPRVQDYIRRYDNVLGLSISVDGNKELHDSCRVFPDGTGSYDLAIRAVKHYMANYHTHMIGSKLTIAPANVAYVAEAVKSMIANGYTMIHLNCVYEKGWELHHATTLYYQLKTLTDYLLDNDLFTKIYLSIFQMNPGDKYEGDNNWCGGDGQMLAINWKGRYYPCLRYMEDSVGEECEYHIGDIWEGIGQNPLTAQRVADLEALTNSSQSTQECLDCNISAGCGYCTALNYQETGSINKRLTYICDMHYAEVLASMYYFNSVFKKLDIPDRIKFNGLEEKALAIIPQDEYNMLKEMSKDGDWDNDNP